jgi:uncharacterized protein (DUF433 family)
MREVVSDEAVLGGSPRLAGTRIGVLHIYRQYQQGDPPEEIASRYEGVSVADVHTALAYAFDSSDRIQNLEAGEQEAIERIRSERPVDPEEFTQKA